MSAARLPVFAAIVGVALVIGSILAFERSHVEVAVNADAPTPYRIVLHQIDRVRRIHALELDIARKRELVRRLEAELAERQRRGYY